MRIGIDARLWNETGVGRYIRNLVRSLEKNTDAKKHDFVLFLKEPEYQSLLFESNFKKVKADVHWHSLSEQFYFPKIINSQNLDLMHFTYFSMPIFYQGPFVLTIHDLILHSFSTGKASTHSAPFYYLKREGYKFIISKSAEKARRIIAPSQATKDEIVKRLGVDPEKIVVTHEGVDDFSENPHQLSLELKKKVGTKYFLYVGNVYPHKNVEFMIKNFINFRKEKKDSNLVFVGREDYFYKQLTKEFGNSEGIVFLNDVDDKELLSLYQHSVAVISPSLMEGFGLTPLEGIKSGTISITSDIPVFHELLQDNSFYFNPSDSNSFLKQLLLVYNLSKDKRKKMIKSGRRLSKRFSWDKMANQTRIVYESSIGL